MPDISQQTCGAGHDVHKKFAVKEKSLGDLLNLKNYKLLIPSYQRPYEWRQREVQVLLNDLKKSQDAAEADQYVLLGSILLFQQSDDPCQVVDGQQRLSTMVLIYSALYHRLQQLESTADNSDSSKYLEDFSSRFIKNPTRILQLNNALAGDATESADKIVKSWEDLTDFADSNIDVDEVLKRKNPDKCAGRWREIYKWVEQNLKGTAAVKKFVTHLDEHVYISITRIWHLSLALQCFVRCNTTGNHYFM